ncbi:MAG: hypothetical protein WCE21_04540 [Candidatus Babeliales bacterium]
MHFIKSILTFIAITLSATQLCARGGGCGWGSFVGGFAGGALGSSIANSGNRQTVVERQVVREPVYVQTAPAQPAYDEKAAEMRALKRENEYLQKQIEQDKKQIEQDRRERHMVQEQLKNLQNQINQQHSAPRCSSPKQGMKKNIRPARTAAQAYEKNDIETEYEALEQEDQSPDSMDEDNHFLVAETEAPDWAPAALEKGVEQIK